VAAEGVVGLISAALDFGVDHRKVAEVVPQEGLQGGEPVLNAFNRMLRECAALGGAHEPETRNEN
jgi:hypothetical protein